MKIERNSKWLDKQLLPELFELQNVVENVPWHLNQSVYDHLIKTWDSFHKVTNFGFLTSAEKKHLNQYLNSCVSGSAKFTLLDFCALTHDIGKGQVIIYQSDGSTKCPGHEKVGAELIRPIAKRLKFDETETDYISGIIANHDWGHQACAKAVSGLGQQESFDWYLQKSANLHTEILLLTLSDLMGGDLERSDYVEYKFRKNLLEKWIYQCTQFLGNKHLSSDKQ